MMEGIGRNSLYCYTVNCKWWRQPIPFMRGNGKSSKSGKTIILCLEKRVVQNGKRLVSNQSTYIKYLHIKKGEVLSAS